MKRFSKDLAEVVLVDRSVLNLLCISQDENLVQTDWHDACTELWSEVVRKHKIDPDALVRIGFGQMQRPVLIAPFNLFDYVSNPPGEAHWPACFGAGEGWYQGYPILSGSATYLGVSHPASDDLDFTVYVPVGIIAREQQAALQRLDDLATLFGAVEVIVKYARSKTKAKPNRRQTSLKQIISGLRANLTGKRLVDEITTVHGGKGIIFDNVTSIQFERKQRIEDRDRSVTVHFQFAHDMVANTDCFPFQELHFCEPQTFLHAKHPWVIHNFHRYASFLLSEMGKFKSSDRVKAAKRAFALAGLLGEVDIQKKLHIVISSLDGSLDAMETVYGEGVLEFVAELDRITNEAFQEVTRRRVS